MITLRQLGPQGLRRLLEVQRAQEDLEFPGGWRARKAAFAARLLIDHERHLHLIRQRITQVYETAEAQHAIARHVDRRRNLLKKMADRVAIAYDTPPSREVKGVAERRQRAFLAAYKEASTAIEAVAWGRDAWICNVVHVLPRIEGGKLSWVVVRPHAADVVWDPAGEAKPSILLYETRSRGASCVAVDGERWWWLSDAFEVLAEEEHAMGPRPWGEFRCAQPPADDYWDRGRGAQLVDATLELGRLSAHMAWARKHQSKKAAYLVVGTDDKLPPGQMLNGEDPLFIRGDGVNIGALDLIVPVKDFDDEMRLIARDAAEAIGVPYHDSDSDPGPTSPRDQAQLVKVRNAQIKYLTLGEERLAKSAAAELVRVNHPGALDPEAVAEGFRIEFAPLTFADHPLARVETAKAEGSMGWTSEFRAYAREHQITLEQAREEVLENLEDRAEFLELLTKRNLPADGNDGATLPERQGQIGGRMSAEMNDPANPSPSDEDQRVAI